MRETRRKGQDQNHLPRPGKLSTRLERAQMLNSAAFKGAIINMPKELKKTMFKELNEGTITISLQIEDSNKETNYTK